MKPTFRAGIVAIALLVPTVAQAQSWSPVERQCAEEINHKLGCAACGGAWPLWTRCTVERFYGDKIPAARLEACMKAIWDRRWVEKTCASCGDPVAEAIRCAGGR
jgi:hypothetical protein